MVVVAVSEEVVIVVVVEVVALVLVVLVATELAVDKVVAVAIELSSKVDDVILPDVVLIIVVIGTEVVESVVVTISDKSEVEIEYNDELNAGNVVVVDVVILREFDAVSVVEV